MVAEAYVSVCLLIGFDVNDLSENANDDKEGLDASAAYVASLLANEPNDGEFHPML